MLNHWKSRPYLNIKIINKLHNRYFEPKFIHFLSFTTITIAFINLVIACWTSTEGVTIFGSDTGADFSTFYIAGTILNEYPVQRLYDFKLQSELYHLLLPGISSSQELPFIYPPFFSLILRPFALLSYIPAYIVWVAMSFLLYMAGLLLLLNVFNAIPRKVSKTTFLLALSFTPFLFECAIGGNTSAFGFFFITLTLYLDRHNSHFLSGMVLGLCLYKPTWLVLLFPMLIITRQFRMLLGFMVTALFLVGISVMISGWQDSLFYLKFLLKFSDASTSQLTVFRDWKYVDIVSFIRMLFEGNSELNWIVIIVAFTPLFYLIGFWLKFKQKTRDQRYLIWACTLTWTPVFSIHAGIYDTIIVVAAIILTMNVLYFRSPSHEKALTPTFRLIATLLWVTPWVTQFSAQLLGIQIFTLILFTTGLYQLKLLTGKTNSFLPVTKNCHQLSKG